MDKFTAKVENEVDLIGKAMISVVSCFDSNTANSAMFHFENILFLIYCSY
jgi:hypothetical protein